MVELPEHPKTVRWPAFVYQALVIGCIVTLTALVTCNYRRDQHAIDRDAVRESVRTNTPATNSVPGENQ